MKPWIRILLASLGALLTASAAHAAAVLDITGVSPAPASAIPGQSVEFSVTVANTALAPAGGGTGNDFTASSADVTIRLTSLTAPAINLGRATVSIPDIAAAGTATLRVSFTIPTRYSHASSYFVTATLDFSPTTHGTGTASISGIVEAINMTNFGSGYTSEPTVTIVGGGGAGATAIPVLASGAVIGIQLTSPGAGYSSTPTVTIVGGGGSGATATAVITASVSGVAVNTGGAYDNTPRVMLTGGGGGINGAATATLGSGPVPSVTVTNGGTGYTATTAVSFSGGGGATATATVTMGVSSVTITAGGAGYTSTPTVTFAGGGATTAATGTATLDVGSVAITAGGAGYTSAPTVTFAGGGGNGAAGTANVAGGAVTGVTITSRGTGYTSAPTVTFTGGGATTAATGTAVLDAVTSVTITNAGTGYTSAPTVTFTGGGGAGATASATVTGPVSSVTVTAGGSYTSNPTVSFADAGSATETGATATVRIPFPIASFSVSTGGSRYTQAPAVVLAGGGPISQGNGTINIRSFTTSSAALTITGSPDFDITSLNYPAGVAYRGGDVIPMTLTFVNRSSTNSSVNVPFTPTTAATYFRIQVVLSANPTYGDADDFLLTFHDLVKTIDANDVTHTLSWNQLLPGNFSGSYYLLSKVDQLNQVAETVENDPIDPGNNIWLDVNATRLALLPTTFPSISLASNTATATPASVTSGNGYSDNPSITSDGRYLAFASDASNLVANDTNSARDIFIYDNQVGLVRRLSFSQQGAQGNGHSYTPAVSADGRYVAFASDASNLVFGDNNGFTDIFVVHTITGAVSRVSVDNGVTPTQGNNSSFRPQISETGRYVVFESSATNLVSPATAVGVTNIYLRDRDVGDTKVFDTSGNVSTVLISQSTGSARGDRNSIQASISLNGAFVAFASDATNLVGAVDTNNLRDIFVRQVATGTTTRVSVGPAGVQSIGGAAGGDSRAPSISQDGRYVAFSSDATNLVALDTNSVSDVFVHDRTTSATTRISVANSGGQAIDPFVPPFQLGSFNPYISSSGRYVAFASLSNNLAIGDAIGQRGALARATVAGGAVTGIAVTNPGGGLQYATSSTTINNAVYYRSVPNVTISGGGGSGAVATAVLSGGTEGVITSFTVTNFGSGYTSAPTVTIVSSFNQALNIFVVDRDVSNSLTLDSPGNISTALVSTNRFGYQPIFILNTQSTPAADIYPVISADGRWVGIPSDSETSVGLAHTTTNLLSNDTNGSRDVFLHDRRLNALPNPTNPPLVNITSPGNPGTALVNTPIDVTASATTTIGVVSTVEFFVNGVSIGTSSTFPYSATWIPTAVGLYALSAKVTDSFGNTGISLNINVTINAAPSVGITFPTATTAITAGATQTVTASAGASNPNATITSVQFFVNGASLGSDTSAPYSIAWTPNASGSYTLTAVAIDSVGTSTTSPGVTLAISAAGAGGGGGGGGVTPPIVSLAAPVGGATIAVNAPQTVAATASSVNGTVVSVAFFANGTLIGSAATFPYSISWTPVTPGTYAITATATDNVGAQATSTANNVTVSSGTAPTITLSSPANGASIPVGTTQTLVANAAAGSGTLVDVQFFANGVQIGSDTTFPYNFAWAPTGVGPVTLTAVALDSRGNQTTSSAVGVSVVSVSPTAPTVSIVSPAAGSSLPIGSSSAITASATDADGTILSVQFFANGQPLGAADNAFPYTVPFLPISAGTYVLTAQAIDNGGNIANSTSVSVSVAAGAAPSVALTAPAAGATVAVNTPQTLTATASSPSGFVTSVQFFVNGTSVGVDNSFPYSTEWTPLSVGTYSITVRATDNITNITDSAPIVITAASSAAPAVAVTNPVNGSAYTVGTAVTLTATASDSDGTIARVQFLVNGRPEGAADTVAPYTIAWTAGSAGIYTIAAQAVDNTGNVATSAPITVTIGANAAPTIALTSPAPGLSFGLGNQVLVAASASDADGTIANVQFFANGLLIGSAPAAPFLVSWRPTAAGAYTLTATVTDNVGNATTSAPVNVAITSVGAPSVSFTNPAQGSTFLVSNAIPLVATASGGNGPIAQVQFFVNGAAVSAADTTAPYSATWTPNAPGTYDVVAVATDSAGISSISATLNVIINGNNAPTAVTTSPVSGSVVNAGTVVNLTAAATDADGTVASVRFLANGNLVATASTAPFIGAWTPSAPGTYTIVSQVTDNSGNVTNSAPIAVVVAANQSPTVSLTSPGNGTAVRVGTSVILGANAADPDGTVTSVQFFANGVSVGSDASSPYTAQWTPAAEGVYRITAVAVDNSGASTTSSTVAVASVAGGATDTVYVGNYAGLGETGRFTLVVMRGTTAVFIGFSSSGATQVYFFPGLSVSGGNFTAVDSLGRSIEGAASDSGVSGRLDGRLTFIGAATFSGSVTVVPAGYYNGSLSGRATSMLAAIVSAEGAITLYASDGTFRDAGTGIMGSNGSFTVSTQAGNRFTGRIDPVTGFLTGSLSGGPGGSLIAALSSGISFSDGFLRNLSTRGQVGVGGNILIAGFAVGGNTEKRVLIRAIGPSIAQFNIGNALANPELQLYNGNTVIASNDNWGGSQTINTAANIAGAFSLNPASLDSVILTTLAPGTYTAQVSGVGGTTGVALVEIYDADQLQPFSSQKVTNVATRGLVGTGDNQLIAGFLVSGNTSKKILVRAVGPGLAGAPANLTGVLADPILRLVRSDNLIVRENDNWTMGNDEALIVDASARVGAFPLVPGSRDAAILINLPPGTYNAQVTGAGTSTGVALVEVYELP